MYRKGLPSLRKTLFFLSTVNERDEEDGIIDKTRETTSNKNAHIIRDMVLAAMRAISFVFLVIYSCVENSEHSQYNRNKA